MGKIIELVQGSKDWHAYRKNCVGASDAPAILGVSKFVTPWQLYMRKLGLIPEQADNAAMASGRARESIALEAFNKAYNLECKPVVMVHDEYPWMIASLDGYDDIACSSTQVEIKCPGAEDHETAMQNRVPDHYYPQLQHQLCVSGDTGMWYWSWYKGEGKGLWIECDDAYIANLLAKEQEFVLRMKLLDPPPLSEKDYVENYSREWRYASENYRLEKENLEIAQRRSEEARAELIRLAGDHNCRGAGVQLTRVVRKGAVDYDTLLDCIGHANVDRDVYRKDPVTSWRVTEP